MGSSLTIARTRKGHLQRPERQRPAERGIPYKARAPWERRPRSSPRAGKPSTWQRGSGGWGEGVSVKVREMRRADTTKVPVHWRARCGESCTAGSGGGCPGKGPAKAGTSPGSLPLPRKPAATAEAYRAVCREIRAIWRKPDCLNPSLQKVRIRACRKDAHILRRCRRSELGLRAVRPRRCDGNGL